MLFQGLVGGPPDHPPHEAPRDRSSIFGSTGRIAAALTSLLICGSLLVYGSGRGLDLTDEIFYLIWARDPHAYVLMYQPFGFLLHPLFVLVGGNLQTYRLAGFVFAASSGAYAGGSLPSARQHQAASLLFGAAAGLSMFFPWIITPSYNSAADVGALLIAGGLLNIWAGWPRGQLLGAIAAGMGVCVAAFAKPPLCAIAVLLMLVMFWQTRSIPGKLAFAAGLALGAVFIGLFLPLPQVPAVVRQVLHSQQLLALPNTPLALPGKIARDWTAVPPVLNAGALLAAMSLVLVRLPLSRWPGYIAVALSLYYIASVVPDAIDGSIPDFLGLALVTGAAGYAGIVRRDRNGSRTVVLLLLGAPIAVALGTFNNQWFQLNFSLPFPLLAMFELASTDRARTRAAMARAFAIAGPVAAMVLAFWAPYSLPAPILEQQVGIEAPFSAGSILVDEETAAFVQSARGLAKGAVLVDLTGTGPGVAAVLGGTAPVLPWLNPAVPIWTDIVWSRLDAAQREGASFVVPVWPLFQHSAPATWLMAHQARFCRTTLPEMPFWREERTLELWRPCANGDTRRSDIRNAYPRRE